MDCHFDPSSKLSFAALAKIFRARKISMLGSLRGGEFMPPLLLPLPLFEAIPVMFWEKRTCYSPRLYILDFTCGDQKWHSRKVAILNTTNIRILCPYLLDTSQRNVCHISGHIIENLLRKPTCYSPRLYILDVICGDQKWHSRKVAILNPPRNRNLCPYL